MIISLWDILILGQKWETVMRRKRAQRGLNKRLIRPGMDYSLWETIISYDDYVIQYQYNYYNMIIMAFDTLR